MSEQLPAIIDRTGIIGGAPGERASLRGLAANPFHGEGHRKVWARLRHAGTRTSLRRVLRLMREVICWHPHG
jgi:putative transposase